MTLRDDHELAVTLRKLAILEAQYVKIADEPTEHPRLRDLSRRSAKRTINQLKEEIARYRAGIRLDTIQRRGIETDQQLANTREKLREAEDLLARTTAKPVENDYTRDLTVISLKRTINQFKEEIGRFLAKKKEPARQ